MDIALIAQEKINKFVSDGSLDTIIENQIKKTLEATVNDVFREYSDFGKALKDAISNKLKVNLDTIDLPTYSNTIAKVIHDTIVGTALEPSIKLIQQSIEGSINQIEKKQWKLSEIIRKYLKNDYKDEDACYEVGDTTYSSYYVEIGTKGSSSYSGYKNKDSKDIRLLVDEKTNKILNVWYENKPLNGLRVDKLYRFEMFLMGLWINECTIEIDDEEADEACIREHECHC